MALDPDPEPNWAKILDPDPNSMYLDPQHCTKVLKLICLSYEGNIVNAGAKGVWSCRSKFKQ